ncbi:uncharacterized protein LOC134240592 [Saccostrea cucullata]|uniref:uncharacterized protein LOC134240592 n=1 Tax=Saccostrea cuccullata TaxID=36930 RepID=UPI002ED26038
MMKATTKDCSHPTFCVTCSIFRVADPDFKTIVTIVDNCSKHYEYPSYLPITKVVVEGATVGEFNQTRCCEGSRSLLYTTEDSTSSNDWTSSPVVIPLLITMSIALVITIISVVRYKKHSTYNPGKQHEPCSIITDEVVEYSTPVEKIPVRKSLFHIKLMSKDTENAQHKSHVHERVEESQSIVDSEESSTLKHAYLDEETFYCTLHKKEKKCIDRQESVYSHFSEIDNNIYNKTFHHEQNEGELNNVYSCV